MVRVQLPPAGLEDCWGTLVEAEEEEEEEVVVLGEAIREERAL